MIFRRFRLGVDEVALTGTSYRVPSLLSLRKSYRFREVPSLNITAADAPLDHATRVRGADDEQDHVQKRQARQYRHPVVVHVARRSFAAHAVVAVDASQDEGEQRGDDAGSQVSINL